MAKKGTKKTAAVKTKSKKKEEEELDWYEEIGGDAVRKLSQPSDSVFEYMAKSFLTVLTGVLVYKGGEIAVSYAKDLVSSRKDDDNVIDIAS